MTAGAFFPAVLGSRQRIITGVLGIGLGFGLPFLFSVVLVATSGDPSLLILPLPFLGGLWAVKGLSPSGFTLEKDGVRLERTWFPRLVPYASILDCDREPRPIGGLLALGLNGLFGSHGWRWNPRTGWHYLAITNTRDLVYLTTTTGLVVISPSEPDQFITRLRTQLPGTPRREGRGDPEGGRGPAPKLPPGRSASRRTATGSSRASEASDPGSASRRTATGSSRASEASDPGSAHSMPVRQLRSCWAWLFPTA